MGTHISIYLSEPRPRVKPAYLRGRVFTQARHYGNLAAREGDFLRDVGEWMRTGRVKYREDIVDGLENAPASFLEDGAGHQHRRCLKHIAFGELPMSQGVRSYCDVEGDIPTDGLWFRWKSALTAGIWVDH